MKKKNIASLVAVTAVATSIGTNGIIHNKKIKESKNKVLFSNNIERKSVQYAVVIDGNNSLVLKKTPDSSATISELSQGEMLVIKGKVGHYYNVIVTETGQSGYINAENVRIIESGMNNSLVKLKSSGTIINVSSRVRIRKSPTMNSKILGYLKNGEYLSVIGKEGDWYKVSYDNIEGYVYYEYINKEIDESFNKSIVSKKSTNRMLLSKENTNNKINTYLGGYKVANLIGPYYSYGHENPTVGNGFTITKKLFSMENIPGATNFNIINPSYEIKKQSVEDFKRNYGYNPSEVGLTGNTLTELVVAGVNSDKENKYSLNNFGSNNEMIFYIEKGNLVLFEPSTNSAYSCEKVSIYNQQIKDFKSMVKAKDNNTYNLNTESYGKTVTFSSDENKMYNRILDIVRANLWTSSTESQRTMTLDMGNSYSKDGKVYYSTYVYSIGADESVHTNHYYISPNGDILNGNSFKEKSKALNSEEIKNVLKKVATEYMNQNTDLGIYSFNYNLGKVINYNGNKYYEVSAWANIPIYPGGAKIKESDVIYVSLNGLVKNEFNKRIITPESMQNKIVQTKQNGIKVRSKLG